MKVTIFSPSAHQTYSNIKRNDKRQPTLGPSYLLACLKQAGYPVAYIDADALDLIQENPDYQVYKMQEDFMEKIKMLAVKQIKESIFALQLALHEELTVTHEDIKTYLNLTKRQRTREFIHFQLPSTKSQGQEFPLSQSVIVQYCLREKALNYAIYYLTKQRVSIL